MRGGDSWESPLLWERSITSPDAIFLITECERGKGGREEEHRRL
jgi:hypothetical protein